MSGYGDPMSLKEGVGGDLGKGWPDWRPGEWVDRVERSFARSLAARGKERLAGIWRGAEPGSRSYPRGGEHSHARCP